MNFGEMVDWVNNTTKRPDKTQQVKNAINRVIENYVKATNWSADLAEVTVTIDSSLYAQSFSIATELAFFRKIKYIKPGDQKKYLTFVEVDKIFTDDGKERVNTWYRSGDSIIFKLYTLASELKVGYYKYYDIMTANSATHWMLTATPTMIHDAVCAIIFLDIGADAESRKYDGYAARSFAVAEVDMADGAARV